MPFDSIDQSRAEQSSQGAAQPPASSGGSPELSGADYLRSLRETTTEASTKAPETAPVAAAAPAAEPSKNPAERRRYPRYKCEGSAEIRTDGSSVRTWATFSEVSLGGCYLEMMTTYPVDTKLDLRLQLLGLEVRTWATVRITYPFLGMGIAFTDTAPEERQKLETMIRTLAAPRSVGETTPNAARSSPETASTSAAANGSSVLDSLRQFFETHEVLTREEFANFLASSPR